MQDNYRPPASTLSYTISVRTLDPRDGNERAARRALLELPYNYSPIGILGQETCQAGNVLCP